ncbi:MAG: sulfurtransferase-like selenium metabolism protein YedF, partial [Oscillospiraceae bacterium]|nr:sulfurtransferase-like selenium metabolism protein YedF [Oscillospiraceae bacterium]
MIKIDAMGLACPLPVVKTIKALEALTSPATVETHVDNEVAVQNVKRLADSKGFGVRVEKLADNHFVVVMDANTAAPQKAPLTCIYTPQGNTVVAVTSDAMGHGSDELGKQLMKGFLYALSQLEELPKTILFYNGGAKLTVEGSLSLEDLKSMEAQGVQIMTCGTCLNYYGLSDKLAV